VLIRLVGAPEPERADLLHEVFVRALERVGTLKDARALQAWLTGITVFTVRGWLRRRRRILRQHSFEPVPERAGPAANPEAQQAIRSFYAAVNRIPADERIPFILRLVDGLELTELAAACGVSLSTVRRRLARAEARFKALLGDYPALRDFVEGRS
jgi:RNA polymerase sigma-70 factor (ECF subfamily)